MSVDQSLLEQASGRDAGATVLRTYGWEPATLSIGYFQSIADRRFHPPSESCPVVRRTTGGGAIVHDREITYSLVMPTGGGVTSQHIYELVHQSLLTVLTRMGVKAEQIAAQHLSRSAESSKSAPFLCFQRRAVGDLVLDGYKIAGSAQRRLPNAILQHGSILMAKSDYAPELPGLGDLRPSPIDVEEFLNLWVAHLAARMGVAFRESCISDLEARRAVEIMGQRYDRPEWTCKR